MIVTCQKFLKTVNRLLRLSTDFFKEVDHFKKNS